MAQPWARDPFGPILKGLLDRWQELPDDALFAKTADNVDFFGGVVGKRGGTQLVSGFGSFTLTATTALENVLHMQDVGLGTPNGGFEPGDTVEIQDADETVPVLAEIATIDRTLLTMTLVVPLDLAAGAHVVVKRPIPGIPPVRGLFPALFRSANQHLIAAAGGRWWRVHASGAPVQIEERYGTLEVGSWISSTIIEIGTGGDSTFVSGIKVGDQMLIAGAGVAGADLLVTITAFTQAILKTRITFDIAATTQPAGADITIVLRSPHASREQYGVMFANVLHLSSQGFPESDDTIDPFVEQGDIFFPPRKYVESGVIYRHGIVPPRAPLAATPTSTGNVTGVYRFVYSYRNSLTGQESVISAPSAQQIFINQDAALVIPASLDPQVDQIRIYATPPDGQGADYYLIEMNPPLANTGAPLLLSITLNDIVLGTRVARLVLDFQAPDETEQFIPWVHANRLIAVVQRRGGTLPTTSQPGYLLISDQPDLEEGWLKGESFPTANVIFVNHDDGDRYVAVQCLFDSVIVFKRRSTWRWTGLLPSIQIQPVHFQGNATGIGAIAPKLIVQDHDELLFAHDDGYYRMSRFEGVQSGFVSERLSLPIDQVFQSGDLASRERGHAVFYRPARQIRAWVDSGREYVFTFDGPLTAEAMGWAKWILLQQRGGITLAVTASTAAPAALGITANWPADGLTTPPVVHYLGTSQGLILQADTTTADMGGVPYPVAYKTVEYPPAGRGVGARGRAVDIQAVALTKAAPVLAARTNIRLQINTDQLVTPINITVEATGSGPSLHGGISPFHILQTGPVSVEKLGTLLIAPGQYHTLELGEFAVDTMWRVLSWNYWYQTLPITQITRRFLQSVLERLQ